VFDFIAHSVNEGAKVLFFRLKNRQINWVFKVRHWGVSLRAGLSAGSPHSASLHCGLSASIPHAGVWFHAQKNAVENLFNRSAVVLQIGHFNCRISCGLCIFNPSGIGFEN